VSKLPIVQPAKHGGAFEFAAVGLAVFAVFFTLIAASLAYARTHIPEQPSVRTICYIHVDESPPRTECVPEEV
jgi:hypothetical protein